MVLADTSVWIRFLAGQSLYLNGLTRLLDLNETAGHELVYGELLIGDRGGRRKFLADYERMQQSATLPHADVVTFVRNRGLHGRGIGWIDAHLLASALVGRFELWTADTHLAELAREFHIAYQPT
jgi:predicted nucleic acid-binding protein